MDKNRLDPQAAFAEAVRSYSEGRLDDALKQLNALLLRFPKGAPRWFAVIGNIHLKQGNRELAADAFVREAPLSPDMAGQFLKNAVSLYQDCGLTKKLCGIADQAIQTNAGDNKVAFPLIAALIQNHELDKAERYLGLLDIGQPRQVSVAYDYYASRRNPEKCFEVLSEGLKASPTDGYLLSTRYSEARNILDFDTMRDYAALMARPDDSMARILLSVERVLNRLYWSTSEEVNAKPSIETLEIAAATAPHPVPPRRSFSAPGEKIRIGYLSNDFFDHVVMKVLQGVLARHDMTKFDYRLFCYTLPGSAVVQQDWPADLRERIVPVYDMTSPQVAQAISDRGIDILVDLKGHTAGARLDIINLSDAPVKAGYLGYPSGTSGVDLDYAITDHFVTPDSSKPYYHEKLCRLPGSMMPNRPLADLGPQPTTRAACGLPDDKFVFCSFNAIAKLSLRTIGMWTRILAGTPDAVLWIRCDVERARENLLREFTANGVDPRQVIFAPGVASYADHITRLSMADLALDTTPYNGHVTTTDMLRAGLPVLAVRGSTCSSRMTEGQLSVLDLPELIASSEDDYVARAIALSGDRQAHAAIRARLESNRATSTLFDQARYTLHLERAFEMMAERTRAGLAPDHIDVPAMDSN